MVLPTVITAAGLQPTPPADLYAQVVALVQAAVPGYTANLPASLISDIGQTDAYSLAQCDAARVELINSLTPYTSNPFILNQQGVLCGIPPNIPTNTSVFVVFTCNTPGYIVEKGFLVTDGSFQYAVSQGTVILDSGITGPVLCIATVSGTWAVPQNTVNALATSIPVSITLSVNNPNAGTPSQGVETEEEFRSRVIQGYEVTSVGTPAYLYTMLTNIPGVVPNQTTVTQINGGGWEVICGGGDQYAIAYAIFQGVGDITTLVGSTMVITAISLATNGIVTTNLNHGKIAGNTVTISGSANAAFNGTYTVTAPVTNKTFGLGTNTTGFGAYTGGGVLTPNARNDVVSITQSPSTYSVPFVRPPAQVVLVTMTWNTTATNVISPTAVALLGAPAIASYINNITVGQPINLFEVDNAFQIAVASIIPTNLLTRMIKQITINGVVTAATSGTGIVPSDPESYFTCAVSSVTVVQG